MFKLPGLNNSKQAGISKRRILFVIPSAQIGGAEKVFLNLLGGLDRGFFDLHLIIIDSRGPLLKLIPNDIQIYALRYSRVAKSLFRITAILRKVKPHVVLSSIGHLNLAILFIKPFIPKNTRVFIRESNMPTFAFAKGKKYMLFRWLYPLLYPFADSIVCPGRAIKEDLHDHFKIPKSKIAVIPNPVRVDDIREKMLQGEASERKRYEILAVGSLTEQKGFDLLVEAMSKIVSLRPDAHLTIIGEGPERKKLEALIQNLRVGESITLAGLQENPYPFFFTADLFVLSSRWEGLPNVVLESLACGTPVVAFDSPGCTNEILESSLQGDLVTDGNVDGLVEAIERRLRVKQAEEKSSRLPKRFYAEAVVKQYAELFSFQ